LLKLDLSSPNQELEQVASVPIESRFHKLLWSEYNSQTSKNLIIGGCENSRIYLYDYEKILSNRLSDCSYALEKHTGGVFALDINPFQHNLLASGAGSSEILIWDLNSPQQPMTPG
jgi:protein transport protein SEC31